MPPPELRGKLDLEALRRFLKNPLSEDMEDMEEDAAGATSEEDSPNGAFLISDEL